MNIKILWFLTFFFIIYSVYPSDNINKDILFTKISYNELISKIKTIATYAVNSRIEKYGEGNDMRSAATNEDWDWGEGVLMFGLIHANDIVQSDSILDFVRFWIDHHLEEGVNFNHTDKIIPCAVIAELMISNKIDKNSIAYNSILSEAFRFLMSEKIELEGCKDETGKRKKVNLQWKGRTWLDDLFMIVPYMTRYSKIVNDSSLYNIIAKHFLAHRDLLQCHGGGHSLLLRHGIRLCKDYPFDFWKPDGDIAWARGNGWYIAALADFLNHSSHAEDKHVDLIYHYRELLYEISSYQLASGLFPTILDDSTSYGEVSATALFLYAATLGLENGWISDDRYYKLIFNGIEGIYNNLSKKGEVSGTSGGTGAYLFACSYKGIPRGTYPWGDGTVLMALSSIADLIEQTTNSKLKKASNDHIQRTSKFVVSRSLSPCFLLPIM